MLVPSARDWIPEEGRAGSVSPDKAGRATAFPRSFRDAAWTETKRNFPLGAQCTAQPAQIRRGAPPDIGMAKTAARPISAGFGAIPRSQRRSGEMLRMVLI